MDSKTICFDFGNTRLKAAFFSGPVVEEVVVVADQSIHSIRQLVQRFSPHKTILSSVIDHDPDIEQFLSDVSHFHKLTHLSKLPFTTSVAKPETIGTDRLALTAAAVYFYPGYNNLVIGTGTCITYNFVNKYHQFLGGNISPGLEMRLKSMHDYTAKLPLVAANWNVPLIGYDTHSNILSGAVIGMAKEIEGFAEAYAEKYGNFNALLTGGDTGILASHLKKKIFADPELIFKGLYAISEANNP